MENPTEQRTTMAGKPVVWRPARTVLNMDSGFKPKLLCDGPTFSLGDACVYSCTFCYVPAHMRKASYMPHDRPHEAMVVRRERGLDILREQLTVKTKGSGRKPKYDNENDHRVVYASPLVDVAGNMDLVRETVEACAIILELTHWHIRLLSKSNLLPQVARMLLDHAQCEGRFGLADVVDRMIFGVSTGTPGDQLGSAFEMGCPKVSKRFESLRWLQDEGFRTFGMICPSLPQRDYEWFAGEMFEALRTPRNEHTWAEVLNPRGLSMSKTIKALHSAGYTWEAAELAKVSSDTEAWEDYARHTFLAHNDKMLAEGVYDDAKQLRLRFLQYVTPKTRAWWEAQQSNGAVVL